MKQKDQNKKLGVTFCDNCSRCIAYTEKNIVKEKISENMIGKVAAIYVVCPYCKYWISLV